MVMYSLVRVGKTLTFFKLAQLLRDEARIALVVFLIDRKDLDDQTIDEYNSFEKDCVDNTDSTYVKREDIEKFAHKAKMSEIIENDNLNIPRYVDTFEEEEPVDLVAVKAEIQKLDTETKVAIDKAESMMRLLGL